jgi:hypothetical protein
LGSQAASEGTAGTTGEIVASAARVRPIAETRGAIQVRLVGQHELIVFARRSPAQISYRGESETIAEGKSLSRAAESFKRWRVRREEREKTREAEQSVAAGRDWRGGCGGYYRGYGEP